MAVQSPPLLLSAAGIVHPSRTFRQSLGAMFRPASAPLAAAAGAIYGPAGTMGDLTLLTDALLRVDPAVWVVNGSRNAKQGQYLVPNDEAVDLAVPGKDASLSRRALVAVVVEDSQEDGTANTAANNEAYVAIIPGGLAASNPVLPPTPANSLLVGELSIPSAASGAPVTITRYHPRTIMRGGVLPVIADGANIPGHDGYPGQHLDELRAHPTRGLQRWTGTAWDGIAGRGFAMGQARQTIAQSSLPAGWQTIAYNTTDVDSHVGFAGSRYTCQAGQAGLYLVEGKVQTGGDYTLNSRVTKNGAPIPHATGVSVAGNFLQASVTGAKLVPLAVGDYVEIQGFRPVPWATTVYGDGTSALTVVRLS